MNNLISTLRNGIIAICTLGFLALTSPAQAVTLNVGGGQLLGASGVDVGGTLYNVEFLDGSCVILFGGCDEVSDFTFKTQDSAILAAQALLDSVLIDGPDGQFDSEPFSIRGITGDPAPALVLIPFRSDTNFFDAAVAFNYPSTSIVDDATFSPFNDTITLESFLLSNTVFAVFTDVPLSVVPLPPAGVLFGSGLVFLALLRRRARKLEQA